MSTLRVSNIEAKADVSSPSVHEKIKVTNSEGDVLVHIDGATSGISTVGINTTVKTFDVDSNQNIDFVGNLTAPNITVTGTLSYDDVTNVDSIGVVTARNGIDVTGGTVNITTGANSASPAGSGDNLVIKDSDGCGLSILSGNGNSQNIYLGSVSDNDAVRLEGFYNSGSPYFNIYTAGSERLRITSTGKIGIGMDPTSQYFNNLVIGNNVSGDKGITIRTNSDSSGVLAFSDTDSGDANRYDGYIRYSHIDQHMGFYTNGANERVRITSAGKMGIGHQQEGQITKELTIRPANDGGIRFVRPGASGASVMSHLELTTTTSGSVFPSGEAYTVKYNTVNNDQIFTTYAGGGTGGNISFQTGSGSGNQVERLRINSAGTLESYSPDDTTPNIRWRSNDTNWFGALNQSVEGGTITSFLSCGGDWTANGTTYSATKALAAYPTSAIAVHNQYNSTWGSDFVFLSKAGGSSTTDGAIYEKLRVNAKAELIQTSATNSTNSWYSLNGNNIVKVTNGDNDIYIERVGGASNYDQLVYKRTPMTDNCDISFRLAGNAPNGTTHRHVGFTICGDGGDSWTDMDRIVFRYRPSNNGLNQIRIDKASGGSTGSVESSSIPNFFDSNERNILIQVRGRNIHVLSDNVLVYSEEMDAALHSVTGYFGVCIYEAPANNNPYIVLKNFQITNYGALGVPQKRPCLQTNMSSTYGSYGSLTTTVASTGILQASAYIDLCGNYTTSGSNAYTFVCPVDGVYAVNAHISMGGGSYARHIWVMSYTLGGGNLPLGTYTEVLDLVPDAHSNHSYYNLWKFTKGTRIGMGINGNSGSLSGRSFQWGIMLVS